MTQRRRDAENMEVGEVAAFSRIRRLCVSASKPSSKWRFPSPAVFWEHMPILTASVLTRFAESILTAAGAPPRKAAIVAESLVASNLRGVDRTASSFCRSISSGCWTAKWTRGGWPGDFRKRAPACCSTARTPSASGWPRPAAGTPCGLRGSSAWGWWSARESNHFGAAAWWAEKMRAGGADRDRDVQRFRHRAAVAGPRRADRHQPHLHGRARAVAARHGHHHRGRGQDLQSLSSTASRRSRRAGRSIPGRRPPPIPRRPTRAC